MIDPKPKITYGYDDESKQYVFSINFSTLKCTTKEYTFFWNIYSHSFHTIVYIFLYVIDIFHPQIYTILIYYII